MGHNRVACKHCDHYSFTKRAMKLHTRQNHEGMSDKQIQESVVCFETNCKNMLKEDCEEMGHNKVICKHCDYFSFTKRTMRLHLTTNHEEISDRRIQESVYCFETDCMKTDKEVCKEIGHNKVWCKKCDYSALTKRSMKFHIRIKHEGMLLSCHQCDYKRARKAQFNYHVSVTHDGEVFRCNKCV